MKLPALALCAPLPLLALLAPLPAHAQAAPAEPPSIAELVIDGAPASVKLDRCLGFFTAIHTISSGGTPANAETNAFFLRGTETLLSEVTMREATARGLPDYDSAVSEAVMEILFSQQDFYLAHLQARKGAGLELFGPMMLDDRQVCFPLVEEILGG